MQSALHFTRTSDILAVRKGRFWNTIRQIMEVKPEEDLARSAADV